jgi:energy-coupling factor transporter ATP-binding protein EcfA2
MRRITVRFANLNIEFVDRDVGLGQAMEWAEKGTLFPIVIFGPEGCGKTAFLKQAAEVLREFGYDVVYVDVSHLDFVAHTDVAEVTKRLVDAVSEVSGTAAQVKLAYLVINIAKDLIRSWGRRKIAVLVDEAFQVIGIERAGLYVKSLLNLIEYPPGDYERIVAIAATSEGLSREEVGRHLWAHLTPMWNVPKEGFRQLYEVLPGSKPPFDDVWRLAGGNPRVLAELYGSGWRTEDVVKRLIDSKYLAADTIRKWRDWLAEAIEDPDRLWGRGAPEDLLRWLVEKNLVIYNMHHREPQFWIDEPPPERDPELGIGRHVAWQTPLHREAVRRALEEARG